MTSTCFSSVFSHPTPFTSPTDNVHVQNSMALIKALNHANVMFQTQIYPDENHALPGVSLHLYTKMEAFWSECFQMDSYVEEIGLRRRRIIKHGSV